MAITIHDVAQLAGVSPGTVSRVIHNRANVKPDTRRRVLEAIKKLDYYPHAVASRLGSGKTHIIGLLIPDLHESYYVEITDAIIEATKKTNYSLLVTTTQGDKSHLPDFLRSGNVDGLLVITPYYIEEELSIISKQQIPSVFLNYASDGQQFSSIYCDQFQVGYLATQYLIRLGHSRIGFCTADIDSPSPMRRFQGCLQALTDANLDVKGKYIRDMSQKRHKDPIKEMKDWVREGDLPSAIFVFSDDIALYVMEVLKDEGCRIPEDISIIGCGNMRLSERTIPQLTTVDQHNYEIGTESVDMLLRLLRSEDISTCEVNVIEPRLVIRESCRKF